MFYRRFEIPETAGVLSAGMDTGPGFLIGLIQADGSMRRRVFPREFSNLWFRQFVIRGRKGLDGIGRVESCMPRISSWPR